MYLNWATSVPHVFFSWWKADTPLRFLASIAIIYFLAFVFEGLANLRSQYESRNRGITSKLVKLVKSSFHMILAGYGLFLMMIFMTYNGLMMLAMVLGHGCGHLFFSEFLPEDPDVPRVKTCCC